MFKINIGDIVEITALSRIYFTVDYLDITRVHIINRYLAGNFEHKDLQVVTSIFRE